MLSDRGVAVQLAKDEVVQGWFEGCERLHLPAYSLVIPPIRGAAIEAAEFAPRVSVDLSSTAALEVAGVDLFRAMVLELGPDVVFANEAEAWLVGPLDVETVVIKRGARGCFVRSGSEQREYPAHPAEVVDTTGAGDAFAAGFLVGGPELGLEAAARCVAQMGAMP
jgi:sugar/nucleoside kinase (ribokinase family)